MRALLLASAIALAPVAAWAQSTPNWVYGYVPLASEWNAWWASKADYPSIITGTQFVFKAPSLVAGSPISTVPSGLPNFPSGLLVHGNPGGYENLAVNLAVTSYNSTGYAQVSGGYENLANRGGIGPYAGIDSVNLYNETNAPAPIATYASGVTFDATHAYLPSCLSSTQITATKVGTWLQTQDEGSPHSGMVTAVSVDGCTLTVDGWTVQGGSSPSTPSGSHSMNVGVISAIWNRNTVMGIPAASQVAVGFGDEIDIINNKADYNPTFATSDYRGIAIYSHGSYNISFGVNVSGSGGVYDGFESGNAIHAAFLAKSTTTGKGFEFDPTAGTMLYSAQTSGNILATASGNVTVAASGLVTLAGAGGGLALNNNLGGVTPAGNTVIGWNLSGGQQEMSLINGLSSSAKSFIFYQYNGSSDVPILTLFPTGNASFGGTVNASGFLASNTAGVACSAGAVSLSTLVVTGGIVTHC
jgi:hypothetical protein